MKNYWTSEHLDILPCYRWYTFTVLQNLKLTAKNPPHYCESPSTLQNTLRKTTHPLHYCWSPFILQHTFYITEHLPNFCTPSASLLKYLKSQNSLNITALVPPHYCPPSTLLLKSLHVTVRVPPHHFTHIPLSYYCRIETELTWC